MQSTHMSQILANLAKGMGRRTSLTHYKVLKSPRVPDGTFLFSNPIDWCGDASRTDPLSSSARVKTLARAALEHWKWATTAELLPGPQISLVVAAPRRLLLLLISLCPLALKPASDVEARLTRASRGGQCCRGGELSAHVLALGRECESLDLISCGLDRSGLTICLSTLVACFRGKSSQLSWWAQTAGSSS